MYVIYDNNYNYNIYNYGIYRLLNKKIKLI